MQIFYQLATEFLSQKMPDKEEQYGVMFLSDEFPNLGKMKQFKAGIAYIRGYRVRRKFSYTIISFCSQIINHC